MFTHPSHSPTIPSCEVITHKSEFPPAICRDIARGIDGGIARDIAEANIKKSIELLKSNRTFYIITTLA